MTVDVHTALRTYLAAQLTSYNIYAGVTYPPSGYNPEAKVGITFKVRGGQYTEQDSHLLPSMQFKVYARDVKTAWTAYLSLDQALTDPAADTKIQWAIPEGMGTPITDPETGWDAILAFYQIMIRNA